MAKQARRKQTRKKPEAERVPAKLVGAAGEALVAGELLRRGVEVTYPAVDSGIDFFVFNERKPKRRAVPIQVKSYSNAGYKFKKDWFKFTGIVLIQVWYVTREPHFYIFSNIGQVVRVLGESAKTDSWREKGEWYSGRPTDEQMNRIERHRDKWARILNQLK